MAVETIEYGKTIRVTIDRVETTDILDYAQALIEENQWYHYGDPNIDNRFENSMGEPTEAAKQGYYTLHEAVNTAGYKLFPKADGGRGDKESQGLRPPSVKMLGTVIEEYAAQKGWGTPTGERDKWFNDLPQVTEADVLEVLAQAKVRV